VMSVFTKTRRLYILGLPVVLGLAGLINLGFSVGAPLLGSPIRQHAEGSLTHLVHTEERPVDMRYGFYLELGDVADGGTLVVPPLSPVQADLARAISNVTVIVKDYEPTPMSPGAFPNEDPLGHLSVDDQDLPYWIYPSEGEDQWWLARFRDGLIVIPEAMEQVPRSSSG
jgi:hypothetical protein